MNKVRKKQQKIGYTIRQSRTPVLEEQTETAITLAKNESYNHDIAQIVDSKIKLIYDLFSKPTQKLFKTALKSEIG